MTEALLVRRILKALRQAGAVAVKYHGSAFGTAGTPDILGCFRGRAFALEVKLRGREKTVTPLQAKRLREWRTAGAVAEVVTSVEEALEYVTTD